MNPAETASAERKRHSSYERIYRVVRRIPAGRVCTYGDIAILAGLPRQARLVGYALFALSDPTVPWHRVINARGAISPRGAHPQAELKQRRLLEAEGVVFELSGRISLERWGWSGRTPRGKAAARTRSG